DVGVGWRAELVRAPAPHLRFGFQLDVRLQPNHSFVIHNAGRLLTRMVAMENAKCSSPDGTDSRLERGQPCPRIRASGSSSGGQGCPRSLAYAETTPDRCAVRRTGRPHPRLIPPRARVVRGHPDGVGARLSPTIPGRTRGRGKSPA